VSLAVVVVEASTQSGSLQTARFALDQGREVLAVPGTVLTGRFRGSHGLLRDGAKLVESASDILDELRLPAAGADALAPALFEHANEPDPVLDSMTAGEPCELQELIVRTGLPPGDVLQRVLRLEVQGRVLRTPGPRYIRPSRW
jgi:DNA processing protein